MTDSSLYDQLVALLRQLGVRTLDDREIDGEWGFAVPVPLIDGSTVTLDLPLPPFLGGLDPDGIGVAILDPLGHTRTAWGLAKKLPFFKPDKSVLDTQIGRLLEASYQGANGFVYLDGCRYFSAGLMAGDLTDVFVLVVNAGEERAAKTVASTSVRMATTLKRLGKTLTMNQTTSQICVAAAHEIASSAELAAVFIWTLEPEENHLNLTAHVGANRQGTAALSKLLPSGGSSCMAELVATNRQPFMVGSVFDNFVTANLEGKACYLKPGGLGVYPLVISDRLLGVLELIGRDSDVGFEENQELFQTVAEHLALALNSASMYETAEKWASHDALTGIANHRSLQEFLIRRQLEAERVGSELGLIMMDVDHFRSFNEEEGHDAGDDVLKFVVEAMKTCIRPYDLAARYGGEEFTVVLPGSSRATTEGIAERIRAKVEALPLVTRSGRTRHVTASLGCAVYPLTAGDVPTLLKAADAALFEAKRAGRNRVVFFEGAYVPKPGKPTTDMRRVESWVAKQDKRRTADLMECLQGKIDELAHALPLSPSQTQILKALVQIVTTYRRAEAEADEGLLEAMESAEEFRLLLPSLRSLDERFDGKGPHAVTGARIPLLARVLAALLAMEANGGEDLFQDPGRFDPDIVALLSELRDAA